MKKQGYGEKSSVSLVKLYKYNAKFADFTVLCSLKFIINGNIIERKFKDIS